MLAVHLQLSERLYSFTRHWEYLQLDEAPFVLLVLSIGLMWLAWRRFLHARREIQSRERIQAQLMIVLAENRRLAQERLRIQEEERKRLARELHDELGQYLNTIKLDATSLQQEGDEPSGATASAATAIMRNTDHMHGVVSDMIARLRPVGLDELGLAAAIEHCVEQWQRRLPQTRISWQYSGDIDSLSDELALTIYRIVQEGLTNIYKHAAATQVHLRLDRSPFGDRAMPQVRMVIHDNGRGMEALPTGIPGRFGLSGMRERVELVGGHFELTSTGGHGLTVTVDLPVSDIPRMNE